MLESPSEYLNRLNSGTARIKTNNTMVGSRYKYGSALPETNGFALVLRGIPFTSFTRFTLETGRAPDPSGGPCDAC